MFKWHDAIKHNLKKDTQNFIFLSWLLQNYDHQVEVSLAMNILALHTLENILRLADNTLESQAGILPADRVPPPEK